MSDFAILLLILLLFLCLVVTVVGFVFYSGLLSEVVVRAGIPPVKKIVVAYKFRKGAYKDCGSSYTESSSICPKLRSIGLFYDDPNQTPAEQCRYIVGSILSEGEVAPEADLQRLYEKFGYKIITFPEIPSAVTSTFPNRTALSPTFGAYRVYPQLSDYIKERGLDAYPFLEICYGDVIHYMCPLSNQSDFFVPEAEEKTAGDDRGRMEDEPRAEDVSGTVKDAAGAAEVSAAPQQGLAGGTDVCHASPSPPEGPLQAQTHTQTPEEQQSKEGEQGAIGSGESVGSGSSFEELDMEEEEGGEEGSVTEGDASSSSLAEPTAETEVVKAEAE